MLISAIDTLIKRNREFAKSPGTLVYVFSYPPLEYHEFVDGKDDNMDVYMNIIRPRNTITLHGLLYVRGLKAQVVIRGNVVSLSKNLNPLMLALSSEFRFISHWGFGV